MPVYVWVVLYLYVVVYCCVVWAASADGCNDTLSANQFNYLICRYVTLEHA